MGSLQKKIILKLLFAFVFTCQSALQANILKLIGKDFGNLPPEIVFHITQIEVDNCVSHKLPSIVFDQILGEDVLSDVPNESFIGTFIKKTPISFFIADKSVSIINVILSQDGNTALFQLSNGTFKLSTKQPSGKFAFLQDLDIQNKNPDVYITAIQKISFDGNVIAVLLSDKTWRLWTKQSNGQFVPLSIGNRFIDVKFSPDGSTLILELSDDNTLKLLAKQSNGQFVFSQKLNNPNQNIDNMNYVKFGFAGNVMVLSLLSGYLKLLTKQSEGQFYPLKIRDQNLQIFDVKLSLNGRALVIILSDNTWEVWTEQPDGQFVRRLNFIQDPTFRVISEPKFSLDRNAFTNVQPGHILKLYTR